MGAFSRIIAQGGALRQRRREADEIARLRQQQFEEQQQAALERESLARARENRLDTAQQARDALSAATAQDKEQRDQREENFQFAERVAGGELVNSPPDFSKLDLTTGFPVMPERVLESDQVRSPQGGVGSVFDVISSQERVEERFGTDSPEADASFFRKETGAFLPRKEQERPAQSIGAMRARAAADLEAANQAGDPLAQAAAQGRLNNLDKIEGQTKQATRAPETAPRPTFQQRFDGVSRGAVMGQLREEPGFNELGDVSELTPFERIGITERTISKSFPHLNEPGHEEDRLARYGSIGRALSAMGSRQNTVFDPNTLADRQLADQIRQANSFQDLLRLSMEPAEAQQHDAVLRQLTFLTEEQRLELQAN